MTWGVVATVSEPDPLILAFVAHALDRGAAGVHLFFDRPQPELEARLVALPGCTVALCDAAHWARAPEGRPVAQGDRQRFNLRTAYRAATWDWILHIDADEFLGGDDIAARLDALPDTVVMALAPVAERVHDAPPDADDIFAGLFRRPCRPDQTAEVDALDGPAAPSLHLGMTSYPSGKSFFRTGRDLVVDVHHAADLPAGATARLNDFRILHFDGLTPLSWVWKKRRTIAQQPKWHTLPRAARRAQMGRVAQAETGDPAGLVPFYLQLKQLDADRLAGLDALGLIERWQPDIRGALDRVFPGLDVDLSMAAFDAHDIGYTPYSSRGRVRRVLRRTWRRLRRQ